jgi:hypothetical protein
MERKVDLFLKERHSENKLVLNLLSLLFFCDEKHNDLNILQPLYSVEFFNGKCTLFREKLLHEKSISSKK